MRLTAKVVEIHSSDRYTDGKARVVFQIKEADSVYNRFTVPVHAVTGFHIDDVHDLELKSIAVAEKITKAA